MQTSTCGFLWLPDGHTDASNVHGQRRDTWRGHHCRRDRYHGWLRQGNLGRLGCRGLHLPLCLQLGGGNPGLRTERKAYQSRQAPCLCIFPLQQPDSKTSNVNGLVQSAWEGQRSRTPWWGTAGIPGHPHPMAPSSSLHCAHAHLLLLSTTQQRNGNRSLSQAYKISVIRAHNL